MSEARVPAPGAPPAAEGVHPLPGPDWRVALVHGAGLARTATLADLLQPWRLVRPWQTAARQADVVLAWGQRDSARRARDWAQRRGLPVCHLEDGFLRSVGLGPEGPPWSMMVDDLGVYFDARGPSRLEARIARPRSVTELARGEALAAAWRNHRVSKYNAARERPGLLREGDVLVVDQTWGDASVVGGLADAASFERMLEAALDEHPGRRIVLKVHPDVRAGRKRGHFQPDRWSAAKRRRIEWLADAVHPAGLLEAASAVYAVTSQMGFEALLWQRPVRCFGMPFYAGWGLTQDDLPPPPRRAVGASLPALTLAALGETMRCLDPDTGRPGRAEDLIAWMGLQLRLRRQFPEHVAAVGFSPWKRPLVRSFLAGSEVRFVPAGRPLAEGEPRVLWGRQPGPSGPSGPEIRLEDGFLRSVGRGADLVRPLSWVADGRGIHYDTGRASDLSDLLATEVFDEALCARAARLRQRLLQAGVTKYNVGQGGWRRPLAAAGRPVVLVVGQVESDASLRHGAPGVRTNLGLVQAVRRDCPDAWLLYKPHPDVVARLRAQGIRESEADGACDEVVGDVPIDTLLAQVDAVHVMTSLAGFEALMRGRAVTVWGCPFYAGWGLTDDRHPQPGPRRPLPLDALVAGALLLYPRYVNPRTGHFCTAEVAVERLVETRRRPEPVWRRAARWLLRPLLRCGNMRRRP